MLLVQCLVERTAPTTAGWKVRSSAATKALSKVAQKVSCSVVQKVSCWAVTKDYSVEKKVLRWVIRTAQTKGYQMDPL